MKINLGFYIQKINDIVKETEAIGETMNPYFEEIRTAIDNETVGQLSADKLTEIHDNFAKGTTSYQGLLDTIKGLKAPAKVIGIHKKLEKSYTDYVAGCQAMVESINPSEVTVDAAAFDKAEKKQDETTDTIAFCIQRMTSLLMK
ncbi:hypothetical protein I6N95_05255 [Vagococcus sp. BWB3-3]|uniref:Uncharacterized protein n=1 Tax=Vagococcus allomyrinae TaxID=2794353 RepID=A0A940PCV2_9ENTE|nr:hypothetical protein [Vagococcus allomyrinae]